MAETVIAEFCEDKSTHRQDSDCRLGPVGVCLDCGVYHGEPCPNCGAKGFHDDACLGNGEVNLW